MVAQWRLIHRFSVGIEVQNPIPSYPNWAVSTHYEHSKPMRIEHGLSRDAVLQRSSDESTTVARYVRPQSLSLCPAATGALDAISIP